ncbi:MAG TPA: FAD-dependent monooxygenase [Armatimonadota bacterium]|nr:FAD-dependent monooxygenase [Armatimonadota bacterium]
MNDPQILIVGAGPTGLVLALVLARSGVRPRIVDRHAGPGEASRAIAVHARTLEYYRQLGFADEVVAGGIRMETIHLRERGRDVATFELGDIGEGLSPFPFVLSFPQDDHERVLVQRLREAGVEVEWSTELLSFHDEGDTVQAVLRSHGSEETAGFAYLCGCDGASSVVRKGLGIGFPGGTYDDLFFVADVRATGGAVNGDLNVCLGDKGFLLVLPVRSSGTSRLIGIVPAEVRDRPAIEFSDVRGEVEALSGVSVEHVNWFSTYHVHHRVADRFRQGRAFLAGDAGHIHSPAGGQGMNTGVGDAVNLAWKLAAVLRGKADAALLDSYEPERLPFARTLVATTDRAFTGLVGGLPGGELVRTRLVPHLVPFALGLSWVRKAAFRVLSQTRINYRESPLSEGHAGEVSGGERLPWVEGMDNFAPLESLEWQVHVYGTTDAPLQEFAASQGLRLVEHPGGGRTEEAGLAEDALYLVRPDGYVGLACPEQNLAVLRRYLERFRIRLNAG